VGSTIIAVSDIGTFISNIFSKVKTNAIQFKDFLIEYDWHEAFKNGSIEFLNLVSFGLVSREKAGEVFDTLGSATKRIILFLIVVYPIISGLSAVQGPNGSPTGKASSESVVILKDTLFPLMFVQDPIDSPSVVVILIS
jgi:hypothetical protein